MRPKRLTIVYNPVDKYSSSNPAAIDKFCDAARKSGIIPSVTTQAENVVLDDCDAILMRNMTHPDNAEFELAKLAMRNRIPCIDDMLDILVCCDKTTQALRFNRQKLSIPDTRIFASNTFFESISFIGTPCVIKIPDSAFSQGVYLARDKSEASRICIQLVDNKPNPLFIMQEYIETEFDWRIGILNNKPLYACKYWIVPGDFRIVKYADDGKPIDGMTEAVPLGAVPDAIIELAVQASQCVGKGLYGVDIKQSLSGKLYLIEINDSPNIDAGDEDLCEGQVVYDRIVQHLFSSAHADT